MPVCFYLSWRNTSVHKLDCEIIDKLEVRQRRQGPESPVNTEITRQLFSSILLIRTSPTPIKKKIFQNFVVIPLMSQNYKKTWKQINQFSYC